MGKEKKREVDFTKLNFARIAHSYLNKNRNGDYTVEDLNSHILFFNELVDSKNADLPTYKVGLMFVCINPPYWQYAEPVLQGVRDFFLPGHDVEVMCWSDVPKPGTPEAEKLKDLVRNDKNLDEEGKKQNLEYLDHHMKVLAQPENVTVFPTESVEWPYPTLMRYHLFLGQEEYLRKFDYLFYLDLDMRIVNVVGDEILGDGLTAAEHPMYALQQPFWLPYESNPDSSAYIPQSGVLSEKNGKPVFKPLYAAGGFQGGKTDDFITAMKWMKDSINKDFNKSYIARWNDESHWNRYLYDNPPSIVLNPSYVYPDSMIDEYYKKLWGRNYPPKIITLTKPFTTSKEGGAAAQEMMRNI